VASAGSGLFFLSLLISISFFLLRSGPAHLLLLFLSLSFVLPLSLRVSSLARRVWRRGGEESTGAVLNGGTEARHSGATVQRRCGAEARQLGTVMKDRRR
jgi:hypothetical protein